MKALSALCHWIVTAPTIRSSSAIPRLTRKSATLAAAFVAAALCITPAQTVADEGAQASGFSRGFFASVPVWSDGKEFVAVAALPGKLFRIRPGRPLEEIDVKETLAWSERRFLAARQVEGTLDLALVSEDGEVLRLRGERHEFEPLPFPKGQDKIHQAVMGQDGRLYLVAERNLYVRNPQGWDSFQYTVPREVIYASLDNAGALVMVAGQGTRTTVWKDGALREVAPPEGTFMGTAPNAVSAWLEPGRSRLWILTAAGTVFTLDLTSGAAAELPGRASDPIHLTGGIVRGRPVVVVTDATHDSVYGESGLERVLQRQGTCREVFGQILANGPELRLALIGCGRAETFSLENRPLQPGPPATETSVSWLPSAGPDVRLALGPGWTLPSPPSANTDLFLTLAAGVRIFATKTVFSPIAFPSEKPVFFFHPELAYSFRRSALGFDHQFNMGLGVGVWLHLHATLTYTPYFVAGRQNVIRDDLQTNERALGFRHGLRFATLWGIVSTELSHQVVVLQNGSQPQHDLRLLFGIDVAQLVMLSYLFAHL